MELEIIGMIGAVREGTGSKGAEVHVIGGGVDGDYISDFAKAHENSGFDKVLVGYTSSSADGFIVAMHAAANTEELGFLVAHRPGFVSPTVLSRKAATIDQLTRGRIALHIISGGGDLEQKRDGDFLDHAARYRRSGEFMHILKTIWTSKTPVDHKGEFYHFEQAKSDFECFQEPHIPLYFGGASDAALEVGARECNVYAMWGEPLKEVGKKIKLFTDRVRRVGRDPKSVRFSVSTRPIVADTESEAWDIAHSTLENVLKTNQNSMHGTGKERLESVGSQRLVDFAKDGEILDDRLYTPIAAATGGAGNTTALVGTAEQVSDSLMKYYKLGCSTLLVRGFDAYNDTVYWGKELIPNLKESVVNYHKRHVVTGKHLL